MVDANIPTPASVIGHEPGETAVRYDALMRYLEALAAASDRIALAPYGTSHEGRRLVHLFITSAENHQRLDEIKAGNACLADPRKLANAAAGKKLIETLPATAWAAYSIHGDELSSTDAAMRLAYEFASRSDDETLRLLDQVVILMDPLLNPDGRERCLASAQQRTGAVSSTDGQHIQHQAANGRTNHYRFDMNRDWAVLETVENRARQRVITAWNPQFMVDVHEMGSSDTYLMDPPRQPLNPLLPKRNQYWRERYGADQAAAFDKRGWSYYARDWNVDFAPVYTGSWVALSGGAGVLHEQAGITNASFKLETGHVLTYPETVECQYVSSLANFYTVRDNRKELLEDYLADHTEAVEGDGQMTGTFLLPPQADRARLARFVELLDLHCIEYRYAQEPVRARGVTDIWGDTVEKLELPAGTLVVESNQPFRRVAHVFLGFETRADDETLKIEREELANCRGSRFYGVTAWNFPMAFGFESYWADDVSGLELESEFPTVERAVVDGGSKPAYGYLIDSASSAIYNVMVTLFEQETQLRVATEPFILDGHRYAAGSILLRGHEQPETIGEDLAQLSQKFDVDIRPAHACSVENEGPDLGGPKFTLLHQPRVALLSDGLTDAMGAVWHLLDYRLRMRVSPIGSDADLGKYNVLIVSDAGVLKDKLKIEKWVDAGGTLIAIGEAAYAIAKEDSGLSAVRRRRDVLDKLALYQEDLAREQGRETSEIDFDDLWGKGQAQESKQEAEEGTAPEGESVSADYAEKLKRHDEWQRLFKPAGVFVKAKLNQRHWLNFGLGRFLPVMVDTDSVLMSLHPTATAARLVDEGELRLSGLLWPEARGRLANSAFATTERHGRGQVVLFASNPTSRSWFPGMERMFLNAVLLTPGMGTRRSMPW